jgi:hypothetical protein
MKFKRGTYLRGLVAGFVCGTVMLSGTAFAIMPTPEMNPGMAAGGLTILGIGILLLIETRRVR